MGASQRSRLATSTSLREELRLAIEHFERAHRAGVKIGQVLQRMQARLAALNEAPADAGWEWLAAQGDETAAFIVEFERRLDRES